MSNKRKRSRMKWNPKVCFKNLVTLIILGSSITLAIWGLAWGIDQEQNISAETSRQWKAEMQTPNN